jgi:hypothetical protein
VAELVRAEHHVEPRRSRPTHRVPRPSGASRPAQGGRLLAAKDTDGWREFH